MISLEGFPLSIGVKIWQPWVSGSKCGPHLVVQESTRFAQIQLVLARFEPAFVAFAALLQKQVAKS